MTALKERFISNDLTIRRCVAIGRSIRVRRFIGLQVIWRDAESVKADKIVTAPITFGAGLPLVANGGGEGVASQKRSEQE